MRLRDISLTGLLLAVAPNRWAAAQARDLGEQTFRERLRERVEQRRAGRAKPKMWVPLLLPSRH